WTGLSQQQQNLISVKIAQMICCLEKDVQHIEHILENLDKIRALVLKRDEDTLKELLEQTQAKADEYKNQESGRQLICMELARLLNFNVQQLTLSKLEQLLPEKLREQMEEKRIKLKSLTNRLKKEHLNTVLLLAECARFNRMVLNGIFRFGKTDVTTYSSSGTTRQQAGKSFMNFNV
ncbi:MAG: flagellar export chaperone FlgN, partial [Planctomycetota bacterium]